MTTTPLRIQKVWPVLDNLLHHQLYPPIAVIVNVPQVYHPNLGKIDTVPYEWKSISSTKLIVNRNCTDLGPATKLIGCIEGCYDLLRDGDLLVYVDDDNVYSNTMLHTHVQSHDDFKDSVVYCGRGDNFMYEPFSREKVRAPPGVLVDCPCGVESVSLCVDTIMLLELLRYIRTMPKPLLFSDDVLFGNWFALQKIPVAITKVPIRFNRLAHSVDETALHMGKRVDCDTTTDIRYEQATDSLREMGMLGFSKWTAAPFLNENGDTCVKIPEIPEGTDTVALVLCQFNKSNLSEKVDAVYTITSGGNVVGDSAVHYRYAHDPKKLVVPTVRLLFMLRSIKRILVFETQPTSEAVDALLAQDPKKPCAYVEHGGITNVQKDPVDVPFTLPDHRRPWMITRDSCDAFEQHSARKRVVWVYRAKKKTPTVHRIGLKTGVRSGARPRPLSVRRA